MAGFLVRQLARLRLAEPTSLAVAVTKAPYNASPLFRQNLTGQQHTTPIRREPPSILSSSLPKRAGFGNPSTCTEWSVGETSFLVCETMCVRADSRRLGLNFALARCRKAKLTLIPLSTGVACRRLSLQHFHRQPFCSSEREFP